ncbi:MAG: twin-arginine translocation pathway signal, partial [Saprospiraceae bacterium]|nr:twin-arginine translocation pathway signal [Saprospiraceae bacterium]
FGRRVKQNGSRGTDHGAGNNLFVISDQVQRPGFYNAPPDLDNLDNGDVRYQVDFRSVYADILEHWLDIDPLPVLGHRFKPTGVLG